MSQEQNAGVPYGWEQSSCLSSPCCSVGSTLAGSWGQEAEQGARSDAPVCTVGGFPAKVNASSPLTFIRRQVKNSYWLLKIWLCKYFLFNPIVLPLAHSPCGCNSQGWAGAKPAVGILLDLRCGYRGPRTWNIFCFHQKANPGSWIEIAARGTWMNQCPCGMPVLQRQHRAGTFKIRFLQYIFRTLSQGFYVWNRII